MPLLHRDSTPGSGAAAADTVRQAGSLGWRPAGLVVRRNLRGRGSVQQGIGADPLPLSLLVGGKHSAEELAGALDPADHPRFQGVGEDGRVARTGGCGCP